MNLQRRLTLRRTFDLLTNSIDDPVSVGMWTFKGPSDRLQVRDGAAFVENG
jgi:hypothetical protein